MIESHKGASCVDIGTGIGNNLSTLLKYFGNIAAIDVSESALKILQERYGKNGDQIVVKNIDAHRLDYPPESFDLVVCTEMLEHCLKPKEVLIECIRILKPGGYIFISGPNYFNLAGIVKIIRENIYPRRTWDAWGNHEAGIENFLTSFKIKKWAGELQLNMINDRGGDLIRSWMPFLRHYYKMIDRHPSLKMGRSWPLKMLMMNYFMVARKKLANTDKRVFAAY
jgi:2-polyprenyl-3-methyl-5-hydroxy-6-metoxy-1,4-benzoquinol methylase